MMVGMGLPEKKSIKALNECNNDIERAIEWAFSHDDVDDEPEDLEMNNEEASNLNDQYVCNKPGVYNL
jgi:ubiquitin carboxyl-terminal hydrolase 5/13